jgi:DnaJ-class molecular chaperone with C-terminal Zn finger domain
MTQAFPLIWPDGWPRTPAGQRKDGWATFKRQVDNGRYRSGQPWTFAQARDALLDEVWKHKPQSVVISSNFPTGRNGPMDGKRRPADEGIAVYFQRKGKPYVVACDRYNDAEGNMRSLALALEAMRQLERHGGGVMMERAYEGFAALPAPPSHWEVLGVQPGAPAAEIQAAYRRRAREAHPDQGGSDAEMAAINSARDAALKEVGHG